MIVPRSMGPTIASILCFGSYLLLHSSCVTGTICCCAFLVLRELFVVAPILCYGNYLLLRQACVTGTICCCAHLVLRELFVVEPILCYGNYLLLSPSFALGTICCCAHLVIWELFVARSSAEIDQKIQEFSSQFCQVGTHFQLGVTF